MKNYPSSFYNAIVVFNDAELHCINDYNEICEEYDRFSSKTDCIMRSDNTAFAEYLYENCKSFRKNISNYSNADFENIYLNFYGSRFNCDCFNFNGFSELENLFIERFIDRNFGIERSFDVKHDVAYLSYYHHEIFHNWTYTTINIEPKSGYCLKNKYYNIQSVFNEIKFFGYRYYNMNWNGNEWIYHFYKQGLTAKHHCKLSKAIEKEYGKNMENMPCLIETEE